MERTLDSEHSKASPRFSWLKLYAHICQWQLNWRTRRQLAQLDGRQLADTGISEAQRQLELEKPFWR